VSQLWDDEALEMTLLCILHALLFEGGGKGETRSFKTRQRKERTPNESQYDDRGEAEVLNREGKDGDREERSVIKGRRWFYKE